MLKLRYLFDNRNLAEMILKNWSYDEESVDMFKHYRISSNAIYPFKLEGQVQLLRFAPKTEKLKSNIVAELEFIAYLRDKGYGVLEAVESKEGEGLAEVRTPWGEYYASVFRRVPGVQIHRTDLSDTIISTYGKSLGKLHALSSQYSPAEHKRWSHGDVLDWIEEVLAQFPEETAALAEVKWLRETFALFPKSPGSYGLVHYDFEFDNVFYDEASGCCYAIDFDDAMYHWYAMDVEQALDCLEDCIPAHMLEHKRQCFMEGYQTEFVISGELEAQRPACRRFANLYGYARVLRSAAEQWEHEPDWLVQLRKNLVEGLEEDAEFFGKEISR